MHCSRVATKSERKVNKILQKGANCARNRELCKVAFGRIRQVSGRSLGCLYGFGVEPFAGPEGYVDESDEDGYFDEGAD